MVTREKLSQAVQLVRESTCDVWLTFVRETSGGSDAAMPLIYEGGLTWQSALLVCRSGKKIAVVGNYDAEPLVASGDWDEVVPYVQSIREPLFQVLEREVADGAIGVNFSTNCDKSDGLSHGMFLLLSEYLAGSRFEGKLVSAEQVVGRLRGEKTPEEIARMKEAIRETDLMFAEIGEFARVGVSERAVWRHVHEIARAKGLGFSWDEGHNPIVNSGPNSMVGHGVPSESIVIEPGHIFHIDLGLTKNLYSSDIQRCWYVPRAGETELPEDVKRGFDAVIDSITQGAAAIRSGVCGWEVDAVARQVMVSHGYPEYMHAFGHQVGRMAHDGGSILGPKWQRYGDSPVTPLRENEVYTVELGVDVVGRGYLGIEEMVVITSNGIEWLSNRQLSLPFLGEK